MTVATTIGADPARVDIEVYAGESLDFTVPVLDADGDAQSLSGWTLAAQVRAHRDGTLLHTLTLAAASGVQVTATGAQTALWADWSVSVARWDLRLTPPGGEPVVLAAGWVRVHSTITH